MYSRVDFFQVYIDFEYDRSSLRKGAHGDVCTGFLRILSLSCRILSLTSDCCCAQDFRNQRLLAPAFSLLVHCLSALCLTVFICVHAALSCPCLSPRRSSAFDIGRLDAVFFVRRGARISPAWFARVIVVSFMFVGCCCCSPALLIRFVFSTFVESTDSCFPWLAAIVVSLCFVVFTIFVAFPKSV